jgi:hypothetical protein
MRMLQVPWTWLRTALILAVVVVGGPHVVVGQEADVQALLERGRAGGADAEQLSTVVERARRAGLPPEATASLLRPTVELAQQDLPTSHLLSKTLEGIAKNVPLDRIQPVLQQYRGHTERAGQVVARWSQKAEVREFLGETESPPSPSAQKNTRAPLITAAAKAQQQGIPAENIEAFLNGLPSGVERRPVSTNEVSTALNVLPDLPKNGASPESASQLLTSALDAGYSAESLRQLPSALQSARRKSNQPVDVLAQGTAQAIARGTPAAQVLQTLFQGSFPGGGPPAGVGNGPPGSTPGSGKPPDTGPPENTGPPDNPPDNPPGGGPPNDPGGGSS